MTSIPVRRRSCSNDFHALRRRSSLSRGLRSAGQQEDDDRTAEPRQTGDFDSRVELTRITPSGNSYRSVVVAMTADNASVTVSPRTLPCIRMLAACMRAASSIIELAPRFAREPFEEFDQRAVFNGDLGRHRLHPGPVTARSGNGSTRRLAVSIDDHLGAGMHRGISCVRAPQHTALAHAQSSLAFDDGHRELGSLVAELAGICHHTERTAGMRSGRNVDVQLASLEADGVFGLAPRWRWRARCANCRRQPRLTSESPRTSST